MSGAVVYVHVNVKDYAVIPPEAGKSATRGSRPGAAVFNGVADRSAMTETVRLERVAETGS
jgi:hypothetical protein